MRTEIKKNRLWLIIAVLVLCLVSFASAMADGYAGSTVIVSLGDSFSSGEGNPEFYGQNDRDKYHNEDWLAHRSTNSWPGQLKLPAVEGLMRDHRDINWFFVASSGATTEDMTSSQYKKYMEGDKIKGYVLHDVTIEQLAEATAEEKPNLRKHLAEYITPQFQVFDTLEQQGLKADYVTITIGGNDVFFADIVEVAANPIYTCPVYLDRQIEKSKSKFYTETKHDLLIVYSTLAKLAGPQADIIVAGYPRLFNPLGCGILINTTEAQMINDAVDEVDNEISKIIAGMSETNNIHFVDVRDAFDTHGAGAWDAFLHGIILIPHREDLMHDKPGSAYSVHPNVKGMQAYAQCVQDLIDRLEKGNTLSGYVADAEYPEDGLDGVTVQMVRESDGKTVSIKTYQDPMTDFSSHGSNGRFKVDNLPPGIWEVTFSRAGYQSFTRRIRIRRDGDYELPEKVLLQPKGPYQPVRSLHVVNIRADDMVLAVKQDGSMLLATDQEQKGWSSYFDLSPLSWTGVDSLSWTAATDLPVGVRTDGTLAVFDISGKRADPYRDLTDVVMLVPGYVLRKDGTVECYAKSPWSDLTPEKWSDIVQIVYTNTGALFGLTADGNVVAGDEYDQYGRQCLPEWKDIINLSSTITYVIGIRKNGTIIRLPVERNLSFIYGKFTDSLDWDELVKVVGDEGFLAGLRNDGTVLIDHGKYVEEGYPVQEDVASWTDIADIYFIRIPIGKYGLIGIRKDGSLVYAGPRLPEHLQEITSWTGIKVD